MSEHEEIREAPVTDLLIDVAQPEAHEDSPERKAAWDEIKRRDAELVQTKRELAGLALSSLKDQAVVQAVGKWKVAREAFIGRDYDAQADDALKLAEEDVLARWEETQK